MKRYPLPRRFSLSWEQRPFEVVTDGRAVLEINPIGWTPSEYDWAEISTQAWEAVREWDGYVASIMSDRAKDDRLTGDGP